MNIMELKEMNQNRIVYLYRPEGAGEPGEISYDLIRKVPEIIRRASEDPNENYAKKAMLKVEDIVSANNLPMRCVQAWY